jgi:P-type Mg2+ transporter
MVAPDFLIFISHAYDVLSHGSCHHERAVEDRHTALGLGLPRGAGTWARSLVAKQILLNNFLSDVPLMAISTDRVDAARVTHPPRWDITQVQRYMICLRAPQLGLRPADLRRRSNALACRCHIPDAWFVLSLCTELGVVLVLRTRGLAWRSRPGSLLLWTTVAATALALAVPFGPGSQLFGFVPLSIAEMATVVAIVTTYLAATEATKAWFFRVRGPTPG